MRDAPIMHYSFKKHDCYLYALLSVPYGQDSLVAVAPLHYFY